MKTTILVIEDEKNIRANIVDTLEMEGFTVLEAENGGMGLGILQLHLPDLIVCDINMPDFDGYQILRHVRQREELSKTPFLFLTAMTDRKSMRRGMELGADDYLTKPFTTDELLSAIQSRLQRHETMMSYSSGDLEKAKKHLTRLVSHELRTPLSSIVMIEQIISRQIDALSKEQIQDLLHSWKSGAHRLHHLVEQMVLLTQIDSGAFNADDIQANGVIQDVWSMVESAVGVARQFAYRHPHGEIRLEETETMLNIQCHHQALQHALAEIISNALDFSPEGTIVVITLHKRGRYAEINIIDRGPGLTTRRLERALLPFEQIEREKQEQQGMGLGLPIAKKIIELHHGHILFQKVASGGTKVILSLPCS